jgi:hypothetical protein
MLDMSSKQPTLPYSNHFTHYILDDGRIWSIEEGNFVPEIPSDGRGVSCPDEQGLIARLDFYHFPKGELKTDAEYAAEARGKRNALIAETDYLVMPDYPLDEERKAAVLAYRQALRDVPEQEGFPRQVDWPVKP